MTSAIPKLSAMAGAACLVATMALPAHAAAAPETGSIAVTRLAAQQLAPSAAGVTALVRDAVVVTEIPKPVVVVAPPAPVAAARVTTPASGASQAPSFTAPAQSYSGAAVLEYASQFVGVVPYGMGNTPDTSFSCDGFTQYVFAGFGISLPRGADHQAALGTRIAKSEAVAGDLVWWPGQHVGIYDGAGGMYDSPNWGRFVQHVGQLWGSPVFIRLG